MSADGTLPVSDDQDTHAEQDGIPSDANPEKAISIKELFGDTAVYGLASIADRAIGFLLLPVMTAILGPKDYGLTSLFTTTSHLFFVFFSLGIHQGFLRFYTEAKDAVTRSKVLNTSLMLAIGYWVLALPIFFWVGETLNRWIFGIEGSALVFALVAGTLIQVIDAVASNRLQVDGRRWAFFSVTVTSSVVLRAVAIVLVLLGTGAWGWVLSATLGRLIPLVVLVILALPDARMKFDTKLARPLASYGALLVPAILSFYIMTIGDKYLIRALTANPLEQVGFYSVGERIAGVMQMANLAFIFGWQRFAFRNMHLEEGPSILGRGILWFAIVGSFMAMALALLGDDLTHWLISEAFAPGIVVITPLTLAALFGGIASAAEIGLHKRQRPLHISYLNVLAAVLNIGLNFWAIPRWGIAGAAVATMASQAIRLWIIWRASNKAFPMPVDFRRLLLAIGMFTLVYGVGQIFSQFGWVPATIGQLLLVLITPVLLWFVGFFTMEERQSLVQMTRKIARFRR